MRLLAFLRRRSSLSTQSSSSSSSSKTTTTACCRCRRYHHHHHHRRFLLLQQLLTVLAVTIAISIATSTRSLIAATTVPSPVAAFNFRSTDCTRSIVTENNKRKLGLKFRRNNDSDNDSCYYWKEIIDDKNTNEYTNLSYNHEDDNNQRRKRRQRKRRLRLLHFGKIQLLSRYDGNSNNDDDDYDYSGSQDDKSRKEIEEHPLRTEIWEMDIKWSLFSPKKSNTFKRKQKQTQTQGNKIKLELHPEGYCRIIEEVANKFSSNEKRNKQQQQHQQAENIISENVVLGIGRWNKGWGVTIIIRPLLLSPVATVPSAYNSNNSMSSLKKKKQIMRIDEETEYIFHARDFHWNGFGSNPKLTRGTIISEKRNSNNNNNHNNICWWKSPTSSRYSSILPIWPEELLGDEVTNTGGNEEGGSISDSYLRPTSIVKRLFSFTMDRNSNGARRRWFRPIAGTFSAKGII